MKGCGVDPNQYGTCGGPAHQGDRSGCGQPSIEIRNSRSYGNTLGYSGTAGNSTYVHDNVFNDNASGLATDSFASGHPGMPQECFHWEHNRIASNNFNPFTRSEPALLHEHAVPQAPQGDRVPAVPDPGRHRRRDGRRQPRPAQGQLDLRQLASGRDPADGARPPLRGDTDPAHQTDTSNGNQFVGNVMGRSPQGIRMPNGLDFEWDQGGQGNCFQGNVLASGTGTDPASLPACPGTPVYLPPNVAVTAAQVPCTAWDPYLQPEPPGCNWFTTPAKPK